MDYLDELRENQLDRVDQIEKAFDSTYIEKGKKAQIGEIRQWKDGKYQMTTNGWVYIKGSDPNIKGKKAEEGSVSKDKNGAELKPVEKPVAKESEKKVEEFTFRGKPWKFDSKAMAEFSENERDQVVKTLEGGWKQLYNLPGNPTKVTIEPGRTYSLEQFVNTLPKTSSEAGKKKFLKENGEGFYSYSVEEKVSQNEVENLVLGIGENLSLYNYFNKNYMPFDIQRKELFSVKEKVESSSIYTLMAAGQFQVEEISFKVKVKYTEPPITVTTRIIRDTKLSMRDIASFM